MATDLFFDKLPSTAKTAEVNFEQPVETEILLADYDAPVFKIVKTTMEHLITQKYIMQNKLTIEGFVKVNVCYQSSENHCLNVVTQKIPFQKQIETGEYDVNYVDIQGSCQYVNTRPQNPTRIDLRGAYLFVVRVYSAEIAQVVTAVSSESVCCDSVQIDCFAMSVQNMRQFTMENQISLPENTNKILRVTTNSPTPSVSVYTDKISVKGEINAEIFYSVTDDDNVHRKSDSFAYNQILDMQGIKENNIVNTDISVSSFGISQSGEDKKLTAVITVQIDGFAFSKQQLMAVRDGFSRCYEYKKESHRQLVDINMHIIDKMMSVQLEQAAPSGYKICDVYLEISPAKNYFEINKTTVKAKLNAYIIAQNQQEEYECFVKTEDLVLDWLEKCGRYDEICIRLSPVNFAYSDNRVSISVSAKGFVIEKRAIELLEGFEENEEKPLQNICEALILYYGKKGEKVFDIAKYHNVSPQVVAQENDLESERLNRDTMLFIPAFEQ